MARQMNIKSHISHLIQSCTVKLGTEHGADKYAAKGKGKTNEQSGPNEQSEPNHTSCSVRHRDTKHRTWYMVQQAYNQQRHDKANEQREKYADVDVNGICIHVSISFLALPGHYAIASCSLLKALPSLTPAMSKRWQHCLLKSKPGRGLG